MVYSTLFKFHAIATTYVGNFTGNCTIQLNGQAIVILNHGIEINKWPYNCIRQFRAEDETGRFSFVSGRRGPYGVAEYNFKLLDDSLYDLQEVLTEFTGAQFSAVAPGSGTDNQPLQPQQPLPPHHPSLGGRATSSGSIGAYTTSLPPHMISGNRDSSTPPDYPDSVFSSPSRAPPQAPRLPPRDYLQTSVSSTSSIDHLPPLASSADEATFRTMPRGRATTSAPLISGHSVDVNSYGSPSSRPALPLPRRELREPSPEVMVAKSTSYEETHLAHQQQDRAAPPIPSKKKSFFGKLLHGDDSKSEGGKTSKKSKLLSSEQTTSEPAVDASSSNKPAPPELAPKPAPKPDRKSMPMETNLQVLQGENKDAPAESNQSGSKILENGSRKKESPYDHLPGQLTPPNGAAESAEISLLDRNGTNSPAGGNSPPSSPRGSSDGKTSPVEGAADFSTLDYIPRSSPTVQARSITPEHAQHLRKLKDGGSRVSATLRGRRSPPGKVSKRSNTMGGFNNVRDLQRNADMEVSEGADGDDSEVYNVPRPSSAGDVYKVPKSIHNSPPMQRSNGVEDNTYSTPKPADLSQDEALYKAPSSIPMSERLPQAGNETYDTPRPGTDTYDMPRTGSGPLRPLGETYASPRPMVRSSSGGSRVPYSTHHNGNGVVDSSSMYSAPRPVMSHSSRISPSRDNNYESIDAAAPPPPSTMRPARSFESLHRFRLATPEPYVETTPSSPPATTTTTPKRPICQYVDIDLEENRQAAQLPPAKNAPLPPTPTIPALGGLPIADSVYAEITEEALASNRLRQMSLSQASSASPNVNPQSLYNELPPPRPLYPDTAASGLAKAQELAEEEGYELFLPATLEKMRRTPSQSSATASEKTPVSSADALLEKYHINIHNSSVRGRPFSESDVLEDSRSDSTKLGSSIPLADGNDPLSDEYIIVTGPDRRPKSGDGVYPYYPSTTTTTTSAGGEGLYSTPNPSLRGGPSSVPQPQLYSSTTSNPATTASTVPTNPLPAFARQSTPKQVQPTQQRRSNASSGSGSQSGSPSVPRRQDNGSQSGSPSVPRRHESGSPSVTRRQDSETPAAGINLTDMMSPTDSDDHKPFFSDSHRASSRGSRSPSSDGSQEGDGQAPPPSSSSSSADAKSSLVRVMAGSPMDATNSIAMKNRSRIDGNILDGGSTPPTSSSLSNSHTLSSPPLSTTTTTRASGEPLAAPQAKRHNYVNCVPQEDPLSPPRSNTISNARQKRPQPLPRNSLQRGESLN